MLAGTDEDPGEYFYQDHSRIECHVAAIEADGRLDSEGWLDSYSSFSIKYSIINTLNILFTHFLQSSIYVCVGSCFVCVCSIYEKGGGYR